MNMKEKFDLMKRPPQEALNTIQFGRLKGKSDINPQWRIEALTEVFGLCGVGWYFEILGTTFVDVPATEERLVYVTVAIHVKEDSGEWSKPVIGVGGDFVIIKDKNGLHGNDEAMQMAVTDGLGKAAKCLGIASDIYRGKYDSKYGWRDAKAKEQQTPEKAKEQTPEENWRMCNGNVIQVRTKKMGWIQLDQMELKWLEIMLNDPRFKDIADFVQEQIKVKKGIK